MASIHRFRNAFSFGLVALLFSNSQAQTPTLPLAIPASGALSLGEDFSLGLRYDGVARSWGTNNVGQLGTAAAVTVVQPVPTQLRVSSTTAMTGVARIYAGRQHGLLITTAATGVLRSWGRNDSGQLGDNTVVNRTGCVAVLTSGGLTNVVAASAGYAHSLALKSDGTVWAWGNNASGQVGDNSITNRPSPLRVTPAAPVFPNTFQAVAAGHDHSLALRNDGTVWAWGANADGQLGTGNTTASLVPVQVQNLPVGLTVTAIAAGKGFSVALLSDGTVRAWGRGDKGQLGHDDDASSSVPVQPLGLGNSVTTIAAGDDHVLARKSDGVVWGWGSNVAGELGGLSPAAQFTPQPIPGLSNVAVIDAGAARSGAVLADGSILLWGSPAKAALGPASLGYESVRVQVRDVKLASAIHAGGDQAAVVRANKRAYLLGLNAAGQLGNGDSDPVATPSRIIDWPEPYFATLPVYAFGASHTLALVDGKIYAVGDNTHGQLGTGDTTARLQPVASATGWFGPITKVVAGWHHSLALCADGTVLAWGRNHAAQLGLGSVSASPTLVPTAIPGLTNVVALAAGEAHSLALKADGTVWAWGDNTHGQSVGTGTVPILVPTQVTGPASIAAIAAGANHSLALTSATHPTTASRNRVYAWGRGTYGQIGNNTTTARVTTPAFLATTFAGIAAGENHSVARRSDGTVYAWGRNHRGQVGNAYVATIDAETTAKVLVPTAVNTIPAASAVTAAAAGFNTSYAVFGNGTLFGWGDASRQQLGYAPSRLTPIAWRLTNNTADADADGMLNAWETARFNATTKAGYDDTDLDGLLDIQEHFYNTTPANYPNDTVGADTDDDLLNDFADSDPVSAVNGDSFNLRLIDEVPQRVGPVGFDDPVSLLLSVSPTATPVLATTSDSTVRVALSVAGLSSASDSLIATPDFAGLVDVYFRHAASPAHNVIRFTAGVDWVEQHIWTRNASDLIDTDGDGLSDADEASAGSNPWLWDTDGDLVRDGWDFAPLNNAVFAPPATSLLTIQLITPANTFQGN